MAQHIQKISTPPPAVRAQQSWHFVQHGREELDAGGEETEKTGRKEVVAALSRLERAQYIQNKRGRNNTRTQQPRHQ